MEDLLQTALLGTAKQPPAAPGDDHAVDALTARLTVDSPERHLLLRAGVRAVYLTAGHVAESVDAPAPAPADSSPICSRGAAEILAKLFTAEPRELLVEELRRLDRAGQRLPPALLPRALKERDPKIRTALRPVLGERGRWLGQFNEAWQWAINPLASDDAALPANADEIWKESPFADRLAVLERAARADRETAWRWLRETWSAEKAEHRTAFVEKVCSVAGVVEADEAFLEQALDDRSSNVRSTVARYLAILPGSALAGRMRSRTEGLVAYTPPKASGLVGSALRTLTGREAPPGVLTVNLPREFAREWKRDGIEEKVPQGVTASPASWWLYQMLALIPLSHWEDSFHASPKELLAAAEACEEGLVVLQAWTQAALHLQAPAWIGPLWDYWFARAPQSDAGFLVCSGEACVGDLLKVMTADQMEPRALSVLDQPWHAVISAVLEALPIPWSVPLARKYLTQLRACFLGAGQNPKAVEGGWYTTATRAALAMPDDCLAEALDALADVDLPRAADTAGNAGRISENYFRSVLQSSLAQFRAIVQLRMEFIAQLKEAPQ